MYHQLHLVYRTIGYLELEEEVIDGDFRGRGSSEEDRKIG